MLDGRLRRKGRYIMKKCFREPIQELYDTAKYLDAAVSAHLNGYIKIAEELFTLSNNMSVWDWTDSIWGAKSKYVNIVSINKNVPSIPKELRNDIRMPTEKEKNEIHKRDGYYCRFCGLPVIRSEVRKYFVREYPNSVSWGKTNKTQHAGFQALWAQYDHIIPHARGGDNNIENMILTCAACNFGRMNYLLEEVDLVDPRDREIKKGDWDGLERVLKFG